MKDQKQKTPWLRQDPHWAEGGLFVLLIGLLIFSIRTESFWIDESSTAWLAGLPDIRALWHGLQQFGSEAQMPFYVLYAWGWAKIFGNGELALRCANIPWALAGIAAGTVLLRRAGARRAGATWLLLLPLLAFYMNEARPYVMTVAASACALLACDVFLSRISQPQRHLRAPAIALGSAVFLAVGTSLLNVFLIPALAVYAGASVLLPPAKRSTPVRRRIADFTTALRRAWIPLVCGAAGVAVLLTFYAWTLATGHGGRRQGYHLANAAFAAYEWLGFAGLGPPRNVLREIGPRHGFFLYWPTLLPGIGVWLAVLATTCSDGCRFIRNTIWRQAAWAAACGILALGCAAVVMKTTLWGRHLLFAAPFVLVVLAGFTGSMAEKPLRPARRAVRLFLIAMLILSTVRLAALEQYRKDPIREAVLALADLQTHTYPDTPQLWVGYPTAARLYGASFIEDSDTGKAQPGSQSVFRPRLIAATAWEQETVERWTSVHGPYIVMLHRPDVTDPSGTWQAICRGRGTKVLWKKGNIRIYYVQ